MTASELQDIVVATLARRMGGTQRRWRMALGPIKLLDSAMYTHCNWSVTPSGSSSENHAIESLLDQIRIDHPILDK